MRRWVAVVVPLVLATFASSAGADLLVPGHRPQRPVPPPLTYEQWRAAKAIRDAGYDCPSVDRLADPAPQDVEVAGRKDLETFRAHCSNNRLFVVGLPRQPAGAPSPTQPVVKPVAP
jgi:hypothetical protein